MSKISAGDLGTVDDQISDEEDPFTVDLPPCKGSSDLSPKLPDSNPGVQYSGKATNSLSATYGKERSDGDEESDRGAFNYFSPPEHVQFSSNTYNFDESHEIESDKSSIESPRSDGSSTQEYDVTQPEEYEMKPLGSSSGGDEYSFSSCHEDARNNPHRQLYGPKILPPMSFPSRGKAMQGSTRVDDTVSFSLNRTEGSIPYSRHFKAEDLDHCHQPPFGEGEGTFSKVGNSIGTLLASHSDPVENLPPGEEIKQNGGLEGDTRKRRKKKKASQGGKDDTSVGEQQQQQEPKEEYLDYNGNPRSYKDLRESPSRHHEGSKAANPTTSKSPLSLGSGHQVESDLHKTEPPCLSTLSSNSQNTESRAALGSERLLGKSRRKTKKDVTISSEKIAGYKGDEDIETILKYVNGNSHGNKKGGGNRKGVANALGKVNNKSESVKKEKAAHHPNPMPNEIGEKDGSVREGVENMGISHSYSRSSANDASSAMSVQTGDAGDIPVVSEEKPAEKVQVGKTAEEGSELRRNKSKNSTKQSNDKPVENNNVKKPSNKGEGGSKASKKVEKDGAGTGSNKKAKAVPEPSKDETLPGVGSPLTVDFTPTFDPKANSLDYKFTDLDSLHQPKMESDFQPVTNKKKKQRLAMKEPVQPFHNNYHKSHCPQRAASPPLSEGLVGDKSSTYDFSLTGFPALAKKAGASQKHVRRNSIGEVPVDPSPPVQDDSDIESVKSLPAAQCAWIGESVNPRPLSYAKMAASKPEGPGPSPEGGRSSAQKTTVWKGSVTERRHSIGSKPEKQRQDSGGGGDLRSRHKSGSQEVLKTDDKECMGVSRNQAEPAVATADAPRDLGLPAPNIEQDFPRLQVSSAPPAAPSEAKVQPPVAHVQSSLHSPSQNSEGTPLSASAAAAAPSLVKVTNSAAPARSQNASVVSSVPDTSSPAARSQPQPGEAVEGGQDCRRSKPLAAKVPNNGRKQPVFFCDRKSGNEPQNLGITFGFDSSIDIKQAPQEVPQQSSSHHQMVTFGMEQGDGPDTATLLASISRAPLSQPPNPPNQHTLSVSDSSKVKLGRMNGVVSSACKQLEGGGGVTVAPVQVPTAQALDVGQAGPSVGQAGPSVGQAALGVGQGAPGVAGQPVVSCAGQGVPNLTGQGVLPGVSGAGTGGQPTPAVWGQTAQGATGQGTAQRKLVQYGTRVMPGNGPNLPPRFIEYREIPQSPGNFNLEESVAFLQRMWDRAVNAKNSDGSPSVVYLDD